MFDVDSLLTPDMVPPFPNPVMLQEQLRHHLNGLVREAQQESEIREQLLQEESAIGQFLIYSGAFLYGAGHIVTDLAEFGSSFVGIQDRLSFQLPDIPNLSDDSKEQLRQVAKQIKSCGNISFAGAGQSLMNVRHSIATAYEGATGVVKEKGMRALEMIDILSRDPVTWEILFDFQKNYRRALHSTIILEQGGGIAVGVLLSLFTCGAVGTAVSAVRASVAVRKFGKRIERIKAVLHQLVNLYTDLFRPAHFEKMQGFASTFADRYMSAAHVRKKVKDIGYGPACAAALWAPRIRMLPFFGVSQWLEKRIDPDLGKVIKRLEKAAAGRWTVAGQADKAGQHGMCAEPVAISRAIRCVIKRDAGTFESARRQLRGSFIFPVRSLMTGKRAVGFDSKGKPNKPSGSYKIQRYQKGERKGEPNEVQTWKKNHDFGTYKECCVSCQLIIDEFDIFEVMSRKKQREHKLGRKGV